MIKIYLYLLNYLTDLIYKLLIIIKIIKICKKNLYIFKITMLKANLYLKNFYNFKFRNFI